MKKNLGSIDRSIRFIAAIVIAGLYFAGLITGGLATVLLVIAVILFITSFIGFCPLYALFGLHTTK